MLKGGRITSPRFVLHGVALMEDPSRPMEPAEGERSSVRSRVRQAQKFVSGSGHDGRLHTGLRRAPAAVSLCVHTGDPVQHWFINSVPGAAPEDQGEADIFPMIRALWRNLWVETLGIDASGSSTASLWSVAAERHAKRCATAWHAVPP